MPKPRAPNAKTANPNVPVHFAELPATETGCGIAINCGTVTRNCPSTICRTNRGGYILVANAFDAVTCRTCVAQFARQF
jgi:hypothetical protein